ncbi:MAG: 30S ribosomal protein S3 [Alphaproteobacteria bacterium MarineAlpha5_Bin9]|nr:MAG: 30S ribosomal protein S3 [Alphaproteobacteria bacterium MarineAlpha5_Bin9]|tara:strand:+ start:1814 stop:2491 length:678 start_codon:yes stop_codon:yes gene_type:complete
MGQKINPNGLRLGINKTWSSRWYSNKNYAKYLHEDLKIKEFIAKKLFNASVSKIVIERAAKKVRITLYSSKPGIIIGKKGTDIENLKKTLSKMINLEIFLDIKEIRKPEIEAILVAENIANQLEKRISFRRAMKKAVQSSMRLGAKGVKVEVSGRLGGTEIARTEKYHEGSVPLHTLRNDIDYATARAETTYGICGVKVWINKGEILAKDPLASEKNLQEQGNIR